MKIDTHCIDWTCGRCRVAARLPQINGSTVADVRDAIERGHERRSFDCHLAHGIRHVQAVADGKRLIFAASRRPTAPAKVADDNAQP